MTNGEKMVWAALYAQALTKVEKVVPMLTKYDSQGTAIAAGIQKGADEIVEEAVSAATKQLNGLREYVKGLDASDPSAVSYTAILVLE